MPVNGRSHKAEMILLLHMDNIIRNGKCPCVFKLLYHAYTYYGSNESSIIHVMNEVVMTFNVVGETLNIMSNMKNRLKKLKKSLLEYNGFSKWFYSPWVKNDWSLELGMYIAGLVVQQEHDKENTNLVPNKNENDKDDASVDNI